MLLAAVWWVSFFTSYWLMLLDVVSADLPQQAATIIFFVGATVISLIAHGARLNEKSDDTRL